MLGHAIFLCERLPSNQLYLGNCFFRIFFLNILVSSPTYILQYMYSETETSWTSDWLATRIGVLGIWVCKKKLTIVLWLLYLLQDEEWSFSKESINTPFLILVQRYYIRKSSLLGRLVWAFLVWTRSEYSYILFRGYKHKQLQDEVNSFWCSPFILAKRTRLNFKLSFRSYWKLVQI